MRADGTGCRTIHIGEDPRASPMSSVQPARMLAAWTTIVRDVSPGASRSSRGRATRSGRRWPRSSRGWARRCRSRTAKRRSSPRRSPLGFERPAGRAIEVEEDIALVDDNRRLVERTVGELGGLDVFVANAGLTRWAPFLDVDEETWDTVVDLNLKGSYFGAQAAARQMVAQGGGGGSSSRPR